MDNLQYDAARRSHYRLISRQDGTVLTPFSNFFEILEGVQLSDNRVRETWWRKAICSDTIVR